MKVSWFLVSLLTFCLLSCTGKKDSSIITFRLNKSDYRETINIPGAIQAVVTTPVILPRNMYGQMIVMRLAQDGEFVKTGDTICVVSSPEMESKYKETLTSIETREAELKKAEADAQLSISLLEAQLATSEAQLKISSLDSLQLQFATDSKRRLLELEMKKSLIEKQKTERKLAATRKIGESDLKQKRMMIMQEKTKAQGLADQINALTVIAKRDGVVQRAISPTFYFSGSSGTGAFGGPIREGTVLIISVPVLQFPDLSTMQISADAAEADFKKIEKGQKVLITVDAAKKLITTGKVNRKSLAGGNMMRYSTSKVRSYEVIIDIDSCHSRLKPGLSANCEITLKEAKDTLFVPTLAIFEKDSTRVVYVKGKEKFTPVKIESGTAGSSYTIITGGLKGDEIIALTEPPNSLIVKVKAPADTTKNHNNK
jgi:HlyD family secretion protein